MDLGVEGNFGEDEEEKVAVENWLDVDELGIDVDVSLLPMTVSVVAGPLSWTAFTPVSQLQAGS